MEKHIIILFLGLVLSWGSLYGTNAMPQTAGVLLLVELLKLTACVILFIYKG
jgi:hypothetical protein